jgi:hypothetical protein
MIDEMAGGAELTQGEFVVVFVVQDIHERRQERMKVL